MRRRDERGAVAMMVAGLMVAVVAVAAFAVDLGMQRVVRSDMQALADVVALDSARLLDGRTAQSIRDGSDAIPPLQDAAEASAARNTSTLGDVVNLEAELVYLDQDANGAMVARRTAAGSLAPVADDERPDAVLVSATGRVGFVFGPGAGHATRTAIGTASSSACFRLGSYAAALKSGDSDLLDTLVGNALDLRSIGYAGLANSSVSLGGLGLELGAATPQELMDATVTVGDLATAMATVLDREGGPTFSDQVDALASLGQSTKIAVLKQFTLGELMNLTTAGNAALLTKVNVLDMISSAAFLANGTNSVGTGVIWNLPAISNTEIALTISQVPQLACGRVGSAIAHTGQITYATTLAYNRGSSIAGLAFQGDPLLTISADVARATGTLIDLKCGEGTLDDPERLAIQVSREAPNLKFAVPLHLVGEVSSDKYAKSLTDFLGGLGYTATHIVQMLLNLNKVKVKLDLNLDLGASTTQTAVDSVVPFQHEPDVYDVAIPVPGRSPAAIPPVVVTRAEISGSASLVIDGEVIGALALADVDLGFLLSELRSRMIDDTINPLISKVNSVVSPLSKALGVSLAGADVFAMPRPSCGEPLLRG